MGIFKYSKGEKEINKVIKMNQDMSKEIHDSMADTQKKADDAIAQSEELLRSLGMEKQVKKAKAEAKRFAESYKPTYNVEVSSWETLLQESEKYDDLEIELEDLLSSDEISGAFAEVDRINEEFSSKTSIVNKTDMTFLFIATALQVTKTLLYPTIAQKNGYGSSFDKDLRPDHKAFEKEHKKSARDFTQKHKKRNPNGQWINIVHQSVPYDVIKGSKDILPIGLNGNDHRLRTLGHDPVLGWVFGTANILTDTVTLNTLATYRVTRIPRMRMTSEMVDPISLIAETYDRIKADRMNLPAAIFSQAIHLKSDVYSKKGLPVPILSTFNESFASELYKQQYDTLCLARDAKFIAGSAGISILFDMIISLVHGLFWDKKSPRELYEVRTRKILFISNTIASSSSIIATCITENPKMLDIGGLLVTVMHLFSDIRFITKIKSEFIQSELDKQLKIVLDDTNELFNSFSI